MNFEAYVLIRGSHLSNRLKIIDFNQVNLEKIRCPTQPSVPRAPTYVQRRLL